MRAGRRRWHRRSLLRLSQARALAVRLIQHWYTKGELQQTVAQASNDERRELTEGDDDTDEED